MPELKLAFIGFGNVTREFARILLSRQDSLAEAYCLAYRTVGIATGRHGMVLSSSGYSGIDLHAALSILESGGSLTQLEDVTEVNHSLQFISHCDADIIFETTTLSPLDGEPAATYIHHALQKGIHVVTANKGPIACAYQELKTLAQTHNVAFRFEGTVMDGLPVFNLYEYCLNGARITGIFGVVNSTTNTILTGMEAGLTFEQGLLEAQRLGIAEANADYDIDGWDAAVKMVALANVLLDAQLHPREISPQGIRSLQPSDLEKARQRRSAIRLIGRATRSDTGVQIGVAPEEVAAHSLFGTLQGTSNALTFQTDLMGEISLLEENPGITQTAYALLSDMLRIWHERY